MDTFEDSLELFFQPCQFPVFRYDFFFFFFFFLGERKWNEAAKNKAPEINKLLRSFSPTSNEIPSSHLLAGMTSD